jgi:tellurium resistance protein TerZ
LQQFGLPAGKLMSADSALRHSGDDLAGDSGGDDGLDNEIITVDLTRLNPNVAQIYFFINNAGKEDFSQIPYAKIRMYEGTPTMVKEVFASYNVSAEPQFAGKKSMILGKLYKKDGEWKFNAIGDPTEDVFLGQTIHRIIKSYL